MFLASGALYVARCEIRLENHALQRCGASFFSLCFVKGKKSKAWTVEREVAAEERRAHTVFEAARKGDLRAACAT